MDGLGTNDFERGLLPRPAQVWPRHGFNVSFLFFLPQIAWVCHHTDSGTMIKKTTDFERGLLPRPAQVWPRHGLILLFLFVFFVFPQISWVCHHTDSGTKRKTNNIKQTQKTKHNKDFERGLLPRPVQVWPRHVVFVFCFFVFPQISWVCHHTDSGTKRKPEKQKQTQQTKYF